MSKVVHFEINADDHDRAARFYSEAFDWKIAKWDGPADYWMVIAGENDEPGINGAITRRIEKLTTVNSVGVASVDESLKK